jgi:hypothetical protein
VDTICTHDHGPVTVLWRAGLTGFIYLIGNLNGANSDPLPFF